MTTARLNPGIPLLLNGVSKRYGSKTILNELDLHIPTGQFVAVVGRGCWPGWKNPTPGSCWRVRRRWRKSRRIPG